LEGYPTKRKREEASDERDARRAHLRDSNLRDRTRWNEEKPLVDGIRCEVLEVVWTGRKRPSSGLVGCFVLGSSDEETEDGDLHAGELRELDCRCEVSRIFFCWIESKTPEKWERGVYSEKGRTAESEIVDDFD